MRNRLFSGYLQIAWSRLILLSLIGLMSTGCASWSVVKQATPNPFVDQSKFYIAPVDFEGLMVKDKSEKEFKADRDADANKSWDEDKNRVVEAFTKALRDEADDFKYPSSGSDDVITVRCKITNMHGGISLGLTSTAAHIEMTVQLLKDEEVLDEITVKAEASQGGGVSIGGISTSGYSGSDRLRQAADKLGNYVAAYLESRTEA